MPHAAEPTLGNGRQRRAEPVTNRVRCDGKFFRLGADKFYVKGVTYGPFAPNSNGEPLPEAAHVLRDLEQIVELGANCLRVYHVPPAWFLDLAQEMGLKILLDVAWPKNLTFVGDAEVTRLAHDAVRDAARACGNHPAIFAISVVNEVPPDIVRYVGAPNVEAFIDELVEIAKSQAPHCLVTFASFPTTEYVQPRKPDFICFNVYLHDEQVFRKYLARLQNIAGDRPLMLGEYGIDTIREHTEESQARILTEHVRAVFDEGLAGTIVFSFTDDWFVHGWQITDWAFGLTRRDRDPLGGGRITKPAFYAVQRMFRLAPHTFEGKLPSMSVIVCSYNGASTVEACLRSMQRLRYPDFEVIFVDDGSTDSTPQILGGITSVRCIRQVNMGLSHARNVGMHAARGDVIVYTDSDCEADEDWLYYLGVSLAQSGHVGMGGPNLIPDEGSWVADCVGQSPGGPTHVMLDDRTAEHVPGCNMAFYRSSALQINGFDPQFRKAGDDVDFIWRLQHQGYTVGFSPAAQVWHYRRNTVRAYLKQQRGYGEAEALLKYKHPDHFNTLGASHWRGRIYGGDTIGVRFGADVIYHGLFGSGLFQTIYRRPMSMTAALLMSVEWHLLAAFVFVLALAFWPLVWVGLAMLLTPLVLAAIAAAQAPPPRHGHWLSRPLIAYLTWRQPIARGWARYAVRLKNKVMRGDAAGYRRAHDLPFDRREKRVLLYWSKQHDRLALLEAIQQEVARAQWRQRQDSGWAPWDMEIYGSRFVKVRLATATEKHQDGMMTRVRVQSRMSRFGQVLLAASTILAGLLLLHVWPFSRPAVLIPFLGWALYLVNRATVSGPILGLIDQASEQAGFYPVHVASPAQARPAAAPRVTPTPVDVDTEEPAIAV
jgi:GT2 family glycosyltransferase